MSEESNANGTQDGENVGAILRKARIESDMDVNKICADLRISPQALEALEQGNYHFLPGDPYIRALLGSLGRYLGLDALALVQKYNREIGAVHAAPSIAPYKDRTSTHVSSHKQIFIVIFAVLIVVLIVIINQLKKSEPSATGMGPAPGAVAGASDSLTPQQDSLISKSLAPDSGASRSSPDSGETRGQPATPASKANREAAAKAIAHADSAASKPASGAGPHAATPATPATPAGKAPVAPPAGTAPAPAPSAATVPAAAPGSSATPGSTAAPAGTAAASAAASMAGLNSAIIKPLIDSVGVRVVRSGKEDFSTLLRLGKQMQVSHTDTIVVMVSKRKSVEVTIGDKTVTPERKRFKIYGTTLKTF
ncbi:MAG: helix-turn-helix domain-containing protein [Fibrobacteres bacterium]|nr:helix-turn-helix domain-containing protein [Fibrobacterota bacterium]